MEENCHRWNEFYVLVEYGCGFLKPRLFWYFLLCVLLSYDFHLSLFCHCQVVVSFFLFDFNFSYCLLKIFNSCVCVFLYFGIQITDFSFSIKDILNLFVELFSFYLLAHCSLPMFFLSKCWTTIVKKIRWFNFGCF